MLTCIRQVDLPHQYYILLPLSQPKRASTVRVERPPSVRNERRARRRIYDEEMGLREALASHGQDEQAAEDGWEVPAGHGQDTRGVEDVREVLTGCGHNKQATEDGRQTPADHGQDKQAAEDVREAPAGCGQDNRLQKMLEKLQQVVDKINRV